MGPSLIRLGTRSAEHQFPAPAGRWMPGLHQRPGGRPFGLEKDFLELTVGGLLR